MKWGRERKDKEFFARRRKIFFFPGKGRMVLVGGRLPLEKKEFNFIELQKATWVLALSPDSVRLNQRSTVIYLSSYNRRTDHEEPSKLALSLFTIREEEYFFVRKKYSKEHYFLSF